MNRVIDFLEQAVDIVMFIVCVSSLIGFSRSVVVAVENAFINL